MSVGTDPLRGPPHSKEPDQREAEGNAVASVTRIRGSEPPSACGTTSKKISILVVTASVAPARSTVTSPR